MNNFDSVKAFIVEIDGHSRMLAIPRVFIDITVDIKSALFLSQCIFFERWRLKTLTL